jgi:hypothetical protein
LGLVEQGEDALHDVAELAQTLEVGEAPGETAGRKGDDGAV